MSDKLKEVATKLDEIETCIANLKNEIKSVIDYVQQHHTDTLDKNKTTGDLNDEQSN